MVKAHVRKAKVFKMVDLANMDTSEIRAALPDMDPKLRNKLIGKLEEAEIPSERDD